MRSRWLLVCVALSSAISAERQDGRNADGTVQFGPKGCVSLSKSEGGTCVLTTKCSGVDTSAFEFAFLCVDDKGTEVKHTFGDGGFLDAEEYDTEVACATCAAPDGVEVVQKAKTKQRTSKVVSKAEEPKAEKAKEAKEPAKASSSAEPPADVAASHALLSKFAASQGGAASGVPPAHASFYGPGGCVAAYRSGDGTCVMQTRCGGQNITEYDFGLSCVDSEGETTQHLFGKNSFDPEETFDTLVKCTQCLGLEEKAAAPLKDLATHVQVLQAEMKAIQDSVKAIKDHLNPPADTEAAPAEEASGEEGEGEEAAAEPAAEESEGDAALLAAEAERDAAAEKAAADDAAAEAAADDVEEEPEEEEQPAMFLRKQHHHKKRHAKAVVRRARVHHKKPVRHHKVAKKVETVEDDEDLSMPEVTADY